MFAELKYPPGIYRNGTERQSSGRWYDCNFMRWFEDQTRPIGGWRVRSTSAVTGKPRGLFAWKDNTNTAWAAIGTESHLYAMTRAGVLYNITPVGFTSGRSDAVAAGGYGSGNYGAGAYGTPRPDASQVLDATMWTLDNYGQYLLGVSPDDNKLYQWQLDTASLATQVPNSPTGFAVSVTNERFPFVLGAAGNPRLVQWPDQQDYTLWAAASTNSAGNFPLQTNGRLMLGKRLNGVHGLWTDVDFWVASYIGGTLIYGFQKVEAGCGAISRNCVAVGASQAVWMGYNGFFSFNGQSVSPIPCDVQDYVFTGMNKLQGSKVCATHNPDFGEVRWDYPSASSLENDSYVTWNYRENHWSIGKMSRTAGQERGVFLSPIMAGSDGYVYDHETGFSYDGTLPYATAGAWEMPTSFYEAIGKSSFMATQLIADAQTVGDFNVEFFGRYYPDGPASTYGPYTLGSGTTDVRFTARQLELRVQGLIPEDWRWGNPRLSVSPAGQR